MPAAPSAGRGSATITRVPSPLGSRGERPSKGTASASERAGGGPPPASSTTATTAPISERRGDQEPLARLRAQRRAAARTRPANPVARSSATTQAARLRRPVA